MKPVHHLDEATLISYCSAALPSALAVIAAAHLQLCPQCLARLRQAEHIGGALLYGQAGAASTASVPRGGGHTALGDTVPLAKPGAARAAMLARLDEPPAASTAQASLPVNDPDLLPVSLHPHFGSRYSELKWRWLVPGVQMILVKQANRGSLVMFNIRPGTAMPVHSHGNCELTLVLKGAYRDALGQFDPGDIADLDETIEHQPLAWGDTPCICVAATDAPLRFSGLIPRLMQPFVGL